jgi:hypothetical protein
VTGAGERLLRVTIERLSFDFVLSATSDTGVAKVTGAGRLEEAGQPVRDLGPVDVTIWGSTVEQLPIQAKTWPERFDTIPSDCFGVSSGADHRFDVFVSVDRFVTVLGLLNAVPAGQVVIHCEAADDAAHDYVTRLEISASR